MILAESGIRVSAKRVSAIMQELDLHSVRTDAKKLYKAKQQRQKQNLLERVSTASRPNQTWVSDLTYFKVKSYWVYLCVILDLYSRKVIGYKVSRHMSTRLATLTFRQTFEERGRPDNLTFHSDRGSQYISKTFSELLQRHAAVLLLCFRPAGGHWIMRWLKRSFLLLSKKRPIAENTHQKSIFADVWQNTLSFTMRCVPI